jgi:hypothetical protein
MRRAPVLDFEKWMSQIFGRALKSGFEARLAMDRGQHDGSMAAATNSGRLVHRIGTGAREVAAIAARRTVGGIRQLAPVNGP